MSGSLIKAIKKSNKTRMKAEAKQKERNERRSIRNKERRAEEKKYDSIQKTLKVNMLKAMCEEI